MFGCEKKVIRECKKRDEKYSRFNILIGIRERRRNKRVRNLFNN
jgi:hypothetical protein